MLIQYQIFKNSYYTHVLLFIVFVLLSLFSVSLPNNNSLILSGWESLTASKNIRRLFLYRLQVKM